MTKLKKILALTLTVMMLLSMLVVSSSAANPSNTSNITITKPRLGFYPSSNIKVSNTLIKIQTFFWAEQAPGENGYHQMYSRDRFKYGYNYRAVIYFRPNDNAMVSPSTHPITINKYNPTSRNGFELYLQFDNVGLFGSTVREGSSNGSVGTIVPPSCSHSYTTFSHYEYESTSSTQYHFITPYRKCTRCGTSIPDASDMVTEAHKDDNNDRKCDKCGKSGLDCKHSYSDSIEYEYYDLSFHTVNFVKTCGYCNDKKITPEIKAHIDTDGNKTCDECGYKNIIEVDGSATPCTHTEGAFAYALYEQPEDPEQHSVITHFTCSECNEPYVSGIENKLHEDANRDGTCDICNTVVDHQTHYDNDKNDECDFCDYALKTYTKSKVVTINYKENALIKVNARNLPEGAQIVVNRFGFTFVKGDVVVNNGDYIEWLSDPLNDRSTFEVKVIDKDGNTLADANKTSSYLVIINVEDSFLVKIKSFFRRLFGQNMVQTLEPIEFNFK